MAFRLVVSDPKNKVAYQKDMDVPVVVGMKLGEKIDGSVVGLNGYTLEITGGSDKEGFPMRRDLPGAARKKILLTSGTGYNNKERGVRQRKNVRGNTVSESIMQLNLKVVETKADAKSIHETWGVPEKKPFMKKTATAPAESK